MAAIINDRDKNLQGGGIPRITATSVVIAGTNTVIINKKNGVGLVPSTITLTAVTTGFPSDGASASYSWQYSLLSDPNNWINIISTTKSIDIQGTTFSGLFPNYGSIRYRVFASQTGGYSTATSPTYIITYTKETDDESFPTFSPASVIVNTSSDGTTLTPNPAPGSGVAITVKLANVEIPYSATGNTTFSVSASATNVSLGAVTSANGAMAYTRADITGMSADTGSVVYTITVRNAVGSTSAVYTVTQTFTKNRAVNAVTPYIHDLTPTLIGLPTDVNGTVTSYTEAKAKYTITQGIADKTTDFTLTKSENNVSSTLDTNGNLQITNFGTNAWTYEVPLGQATSSLHALDGPQNGWPTFVIHDKYLFKINSHANIAHNDIYRLDLTNKNEGWIRYNSFSSFYYAYTLFYSTIFNKLIFVTDSGTYTSSDNGNSWAVVTPPVSPALDPGFSTSGINYFLEMGDGYLWAFTGWSRAYKTNTSIAGPWSYAPGGTFGSSLDTAGYRSVVYGNGSLVSITPGNSRVYRATAISGTSWTYTGMLIVSSNCNVAFSNGKFYGNFTLNNKDGIYTSIDGLTWQLAALSPVAGTGFSLHCINGRWFAVTLSAVYNAAPYFYVSDDNMLSWKQFPIYANRYVLPNFQSVGSSGSNRYSINTPYLNTTDIFLGTSNSQSTGDTYFRMVFGTLNTTEQTDGYVDITATKASEVVTKRVIVKKGTKTNPVVVVTITPSTMILPANSTGMVLDYTNTSSIKIKVTENGTDTTSTWSVGIVTSVNMTYSGSLTAGYSLTLVPNTPDTGTITFTLTKTGMAPQTCIFTYTKYKGVQIAGPTNNSFTSLSSSTGYVAIQWKNDGWVYTKNTSGGSFTTKLTPWHTAPAAGVGASYWLKVTNTGAALGGSATGSYHQISTEPSFYLDNTGGASPSSLVSNLTMSLSSSNNDSGLYGVSATATITANKV